MPLETPRSLRSRVDPAAAAGPWECLRRALAERGDGMPFFVWESPDGREIAALGAIAEVVASGASRFHGVKERLSALFAGAPEGRRPIAVGGFSFAADESTPDSAGFGDARFLLPAETWERTSGGDTLHTAWSWGDDLGDRDPDGPRSTAVAGDLAPRAGVAAPAPGFAPGAALSRERWIQGVRASLEQIGTGALEKVVLARCREMNSVDPPDPIAIYGTLREDHPSCYRFLAADGRGVSFLGASPERLVRLAGAAVATEAVAGTAASAGAGEDAAGRSLLASAKNRREHEVVARHLARGLAPLCVDILREPGPEVVSLRHLLHLRTGITATARPGTHVLDLVARLHPSPAVAGHPRDAALRWIRAHEPQPRGWYAGPIGWVDAAGDGDFAVGLRAAEIRGGRARLFAGAGIVAGSDPELEWRETEIKMRPILDALARA